MKTDIQPWSPFSHFDSSFSPLRSLLPALWSDPDLSENFLAREDWAPAVDIAEDDKKYLISADLPDVKKEDIKVTIKEGLLTLSGERTKEKEEKDKTYHRTERFHGTYQRSFRLPEDIKEDSIDASFKDSVLKIKLTKVPGKKKSEERKLTIK